MFKKQNHGLDIFCVQIKSTQLGECTFLNVCLVFVESMGTAEHLYTVMAHPLLLHMNKLILSIEHCLLHVHTALWEAPSLTT